MAYDLALFETVFSFPLESNRLESIVSTLSRSIFVITQPPPIPYRFSIVTIITKG